MEFQKLFVGLCHIITRYGGILNPQGDSGNKKLRTGYGPQKKGYVN